MTRTSRRFPPADAFDPDVLDVMGEAFEIAWNFVERSSDHRSSTQPSVLRDILARNIILSARLGETSKVALANFAIGRLRAQTQLNASRF